MRKVEYGKPLFHILFLRFLTLETEDLPWKIPPKDFTFKPYTSQFETSKEKKERVCCDSFSLIVFHWERERERYRVRDWWLPCSGGACLVRDDVWIERRQLLSTCPGGCQCGSCLHRWCRCSSCILSGICCLLISVFRNGFLFFQFGEFDFVRKTHFFCLGFGQCGRWEMGFSLLCFECLRVLK